MSYEDFLTERMRLEILRQLRLASLYTLNEVVLKDQLEQTGYTPTRDRLPTLQGFKLVNGTSRAADARLCEMTQALRQITELKD